MSTESLSKPYTERDVDTLELDLKSTSACHLQGFLCDDARALSREPLPSRVLALSGVEQTQK